MADDNVELLDFGGEHQPLLSNSVDYLTVWDEIFDSDSYAALSNNAQQEIQKHLSAFFSTASDKDLPRFTDGLENQEKGYRRPADAHKASETRVAVDALFERQHTREEALANCDDLINNTIPAEITLMNKAEIEALSNDLDFALYQYLAQIQAATDTTSVIADPHAVLAHCYRQMVKCSRLRQQVVCKKENKAYPDMFVIEQPISCLKPEPVKSILNPLFDCLPASVKEFMDKDEDGADSVYLTKQLSKANERRLFWVWMRCLIEGLLLFAHEALLASTIIAAWVSWSLYWFRGGVTFAEYLKHGYFSSMIESRELAIDDQRREAAYWAAHRDRILNDLIWGSSNFAGCFWLVGPSLLGPIGDALTGALLGMDLYLSYSRYTDGLAGHEARLARYDRQLNILLKKMRDHTSQINDQTLINYVDALSSGNSLDGLRNIDQHLQALTIADKQESIDKLSVLTKQYKTLLSGKDKASIRWKEQCAMLEYETIYAFVLMIGFWLMCGFYLGLATVVPPAVVIIGAFMLAASTIAWRTANARLEWQGIENTAHECEEQFNQLLRDFVQLSTEEKSDVQMKRLYLAMLQLAAESGTQRDLATLKKVELARASLLRILVPVAIAITLLFAPATVLAVPAYVFLLLGILVLAVATSFYIDRQFKPRDTVWEYKEGGAVTAAVPELNDAEYEAFREFVLGEEGSNVKHERGMQLLAKIKENRTGGNFELFRAVVKQSKDDSSGATTSLLHNAL